MLEVLKASTGPRPSIFIDLEGVKLGREGQICLLAIHYTTSRNTFVVDIHHLGASAFTTPALDGTTTLKSLLESPTILKGIFDVRNDSAGLYHGFGIQLKGIEDLQLLEIVSRPRSRWRLRNGLDKTVREHGGMTFTEFAAWKNTKEAGIKLFVPEKGGSYEVFKERPLDPVLLKYSMNDVACLPKLYEKFAEGLGKNVKEEVRAKTWDAIAQTFSASYQGNGQERALSPWAKTKG